MAGVRQYDMYGLISHRVKPLQLVESGRQKVGKSRDVFCPLRSTPRTRCVCPCVGDTAGKVSTVAFNGVAYLLFAGWCISRRI